MIPTPQEDGRGKDLERIAANVKADILLGMSHAMSKEPDVAAELVYALLEIKMPFGLWCHKHIVKRGNVGSDYVRVFEDGQWQFRVSRDFLRVLPMGNTGLVSAVIMCRYAKAMCEFVRQPGNEHLLSMEGMMAEAERFGEERDRLRAIFETDRIGAILGDTGEMGGKDG